MKHILILIVATLFSGSLFAAPTDSTTSMDAPKATNTGKNILTGNMALDGTFSYATDSDDNKSMDIAPTLEYFIWDKISVGGTIRYRDSTSNNVDRTSLGVGPSATWYFYEVDQYAFFAGQDLLQTNTSEPENVDDTLTATTSLGAKVFFTPSAALTTSLSYFQYLDGTDAEKEYNLTALTAGFSVFY